MYWLIDLLLNKCVARKIDRMTEKERKREREIVKGWWKRYKESKS